MDEEKFYKSFWSNYMQIEKELIDTFKYVDLSIDNYKTYSTKFLKIFLQIGSEIDICFKEYLKLISPNSSANKINEYKNELSNLDLNFFNEETIIKPIDFLIKPWNNLANNDSVEWWTAYNKVKHQRNDMITIDGINQLSYKFANLENVITSMSGLYILLMNIYAKIKNNYEESPVPNSVLFKMTSSRWSDCKFFCPIYASVSKDGDMYIDSTKNYLL